MKKRSAKFIGLIVTALMLMSGLLTACDPAPGPCLGYSGKVLCAIKHDGRVYLVQNGLIMNSGVARFGGLASDGSGPYYTREGTYRVFAKGLNVWSSLYGVNMPFFMQFSGGQGFHYSQEFAEGWPYSHGCIGFKSWAFAHTAYDWAPIGTRVVIAA